MKIYDCFMFYDEDLIIDLRLNILNEFVDEFIIVESKFTHSGEKRNLLFNIKKYANFKKKLIILFQMMNQIIQIQSMIVTQKTKKIQNTL